MTAHVVIQPPSVIKRSGTPAPFDGDKIRSAIERAGKATGEGLMKFLRTAPKLAPEPEDALR